jgi:hypothetical protein
LRFHVLAVSAVTRLLCLIALALPPAAIADSSTPAAGAQAPDSAVPVFKPYFEVRLRGELFSTPSADPAREESYALGLVRLRAGGDLRWREKFVLHGLVQGATTTSLPDNAAFGAGQSYWNTNGGESTPHQIDVAELAFRLESKRFGLVAGRQAFAEGAGSAIGIAELDFVRTRRLSERLVGNLDFPNVGRRFDGLTATAGFDGGGLELFALRPLAGAFNYEQAFEQLDIDLYGASWTSLHGGWLPRSTIRLFAQRYDDRRAVAASATGGEIDLTTWGASILAGDKAWTLLLWGAAQSGDYGRRAHSATAVIADAGHRWTGVDGEPSLHLVWERASGGGRTGENRDFFNLLPTNHKFYGALDYSAFSNLADLYLEGRWSPVKAVAFSAALHDYRLVDREGPWVGGSGAYSDRELGFLLRRPASASFAASAIGRELDLAATWTMPRSLQLKFEGGLFWGGAAAKEILPANADGSWASLELTYRL